MSISVPLPQSRKKTPMWLQWNQTCSTCVWRTKEATHQGMRDRPSIRTSLRWTVDMTWTLTTKCLSTLKWTVIAKNLVNTNKPSREVLLRLAWIMTMLVQKKTLMILTSKAKLIESRTACTKKDWTILNTKTLVGTTLLQLIIILELLSLAYLDLMLYWRDREKDLTKWLLICKIGLVISMKPDKVATSTLFPKLRIKPHLYVKVLVLSLLQQII